MSSLKLGVEVVSAHNLIPRDDQGSSNHFVEIRFDRQVFHTTIKEKDLNPVWNEHFYFNISEPSSLFDHHLDACVYSETKGTRSRSQLGKARLTAKSFVVPYADAVVSRYPLEKKHVMSSSVKGELALIVYLIDDQTLKSSSNVLPLIDPSARPDLLASQTTQVSNNRAESICTNQNQQHSSTTMSQVLYSPHEIKSKPPKTIQMYPSSSQEPVDCTLKEISPYLGRGQVVGSHVVRLADKPASDRVEQMQYLFVRVVKAREVPAMEEIPGSLDPFVEVRVGKYRARTEPFEKQRQDPVWNEVLTFSRDQIRSKVIEVVVKDKVYDNDDEPVGIIRFDLNGIPIRIPPEDPLAPEWHRLEDKQTGEKTKGELMLAVWMGTRADEASDDAWDSDAAAALVDGSMAAYIRPQVYFSPSLWYVRVEIIQAEDLVPKPENLCEGTYRPPGVENKGCSCPEFNPLWNEDLLFVAAEPFEDHLILSVEDFEGPNRVEVIGWVVIPLSSIEKRVDNRVIAKRRYQVEKPAAAVDVDQWKEEEEVPGSLLLRLCLEGGYHVLDESPHYSSDLRPTAKELWNPPIGVLELGILRAEGLHPMKTRDGRGTSDAFCVARYGHEWVRTRTIVNSLTPKFDEHHTWAVYDPATVLTVGLFDNRQLGSSNTTSNNNDMKIGKVRIRLSTLEPGRLYTKSYPLLVLHPSGVKKMGELLLAIKFSCTSLVNMMYLYTRPLLPMMHYIRPLTLVQQDVLRYRAVKIVAARLSLAKPSLRKEVIEYMTDVDSHLWSMRRSKANFFRLMAVLSGLFAVDVCTWKNPVTTVLVHVLFVMLMYFNQLILPLLLLYMSLRGIWNYRYRPHYPPHMDTRISYAEVAHPDELDEEFDTLPTTKSTDLVRMRYDRLRSVAGRIQTVVGDVATQGERVLAFLSWRDPVATAIFVIFCIVSALVLLVIPYQVIIVVVGFYKMRHPWFRQRQPSVLLSFFRRLLSKIDNML
ncbi:LOW QUALITY PROTEIN: C2 calcium-dependent membrane targeting [Cinnamomum micranthum f. kanehirae]|uniref:C2 calcium-dependent membrane targeting n=1 Tax=Cinnamomum micranthum f. kanehirae TaxID=337451 RepID=A0A3S3P2K8_9MAGN|nr:LOW QUALITY PROTEIN: C2 calcium-dependent membrane targeting [Cinnamomum micranthum f. kanehirae]